jgi:HlyD family secretion protein
MSKFIRNVSLPAAALALTLFALYHLIYADQPKPKLDPPGEPPSSGAVVTIAATGIVEPATENISLGAAQSGIIIEAMYTSAQAGQRVQTGEQLLRVDDRAWQAQLQVNRANLKSAEAELAKLEQMPRAEDVPPLEAKVRAANSRLADASERYERVLQLSDVALSREERTQRKFAKETAQSELDQAQTELVRVQAGAWLPDVEIARAAVDAAKAKVELIETEIERCLVRAPIDGELLSVNVRVGEYVSDSSSSLVVLGDLSRVNVRVSIDEEDLPRFRPGQAAWGVARGDSGQRWPLRFVRVEPMVVPKKMLSGAGDERVDTRVAQVIYQFESLPPQVFVGQQMDVFVKVEH